LKAGRHAGKYYWINRYGCFIVCLVLGSDAIDSAKEYAQESKKQATKKAKETAEETSEAALKAKRNVDL
jgi:hypothetical protein